MPLGPLDWFPRVLFESQRALLLPRSPQRERIAVDTELWCTLHVRRKNLWAIQSLDVQVRRIPMSSLAQFASGMRQLNCGSSSRFRIHLAQMWVKTNRTKTESMDINTMLVYFWHSDEYLTHHQPHLFKSFPRFLGTRRGVFFPARWGPDPGEFISLNPAPFRVAKVGHMQGRWVRTKLCVFFFSSFHFCETHQDKLYEFSSYSHNYIISRQTELKHVKESKRERFWYIKNNHKVYRFNEHRIWGAAHTVYFCFDEEWITKVRSRSTKIISCLQMFGDRTWCSFFSSSFCDMMRYVFLSSLALLLFTNTDSNIAWKQRF